MIPLFCSLIYFWLFHSTGIMYSCAWLHCYLALPLFLAGGYFILSTFHNLCTCCLAKKKLLNFNFLTRFWLYFWVFNLIFTVPFCTLVCNFWTLSYLWLTIFHHSQSFFHWSSLLFSIELMISSYPGRSTLLRKLPIKTLSH